MIALVDIVDEHREAIEYDLLRCGARLRDWPHGGVTWRDLFVLVRQAQPESAIFRELNQQWQRTPELELLRSIDFTLQILQWRETRDGQRGMNPPEPARFPWDPEREGVKRGDRMTIDEAADWLGWSAEIDGRAPLADNDT